MFNATRRVDHGPQMPVDPLLVERVDLRRLGGAATGDDLPGDGLDLRPASRPVRKTVAPSDAKARATALPMAPPAP